MVELSLRHGRSIHQLNSKKEGVEIMAKCRYPLQKKEKELGTWATNFIISDAGRYPGDLTITNMNIIFLGKFDISICSIIDVASFETHGTDQYMVIDREKISTITPRETMFNKRITIMTSDNNEFIIDYGLRSIDSIQKALEYKPCGGEAK